MDRTRRVVAAFLLLGWCAASSAQLLTYEVFKLAERAADGSFVWSEPYVLEYDRFISGMTDTFTITGGSGMATIAIPVHLDWTVLEYGSYVGSGQSIVGAGDVSGTIWVVAGVYAAAQNNFAVHVEHAPVTAQYDVVSYVQMPYDQPTQVAFGLGAGPQIGPADQDFSNCGTPSETNGQCVRGGYIDLVLSASIGPLLVPEGSTLTSASGSWPVVTVPEPGVPVLLLTGLAALALARRRHAWSTAAAAAGR